MKTQTSNLPVAQRVTITLRAYHMIKKYCPGLMGTSLVRSLLTALQPFATLWFSAQILNEIASGGDVQKASFLAAMVVGINFILSLLKGRLDILYRERESQMWSYFSKIFADKQLNMDYVDIEDIEVQKRKTKEKENLFFFGNGLGQFVWTFSGLIEGAVSVLTSLLLVISLFSAQSEMAWMNSPLWILGIGAIFGFCTFIDAKAFQKNNEEFIKWCDKFAWFNRIFGFFGFDLCKEPERAKDVRIYRQDIPAETEMQKLQKKDRGEKRHYVMDSAREGFAAFTTGIGNMFCYLFVVLKAFFGAFGVGSILQYVGALNQLGSGVQMLLFSVTDNAIYTQHLKSLFTFLDLPNKKYQGTLPVEKRTDNEYEIAFEHVSFRYPGSAEDALKNLNLKLHVGQRLAVVGMNGSGKTTMIKLLCRLYDPTEGVITLNGVDIKKYRYSEYMDVFSVVFQDFKLFSFDLGQNVAASVEGDRKKAVESLQKAGFGDRLLSLPKGLDTPLYQDFEENGVEISGGEAQKIALARAIYKDAPFLLLDEPTAALDPIAEYEVYSKFNEFVGEKTAIYISHRLSSCRFCDDIVVFHKGELIQRGNHETLLAETDNIYRELWDAQAQYYQKV